MAVRCMPLLLRRFGHCVSPRLFSESKCCSAPLRITGFRGLQSLAPHKPIYQEVPGKSLQRFTACFGNMWSQHCFSTEMGLPYQEDEYPALPDYESEPQQKDIFLVGVKGLPWSCGVEDLLLFFSDCRIRDGVNGIHLMQNKDGRPSGKAFIEMECKDDVYKALRKHRHYLGPRYVEVNEVTDHEAEAILRTTSEPQFNDGVVKLQGLPYSCTEKDITDFFAGMEIAEDGVMLICDSRGRNTGVAYVEFVSQEVADQALLKSREMMGNRYVEVFPSSKSLIQSRHNNRRPDVFHWSIDRAPQQNVSDMESDDKWSENADTVVVDKVVRLRGLPYSSTEEDVIQFFQGLDIVKDGVKLIFDRKGRSTGAFVMFSSQEMVDEALRKNRELMGKRYIEVFLSKKSETKNINNKLESYVAQLQDAEKPIPITPYCVHMRGLPYKTTAQDVVNFFNPISLNKICMEYGPDGRPSGEADVYFLCHEDAVSAMSKDKNNIYDRYIELFLNSATATPLEVQV